MLAVLPAAATGLSDWTDTDGAEQKVGTAHLLANMAATTFFSAAWVARATRRYRWATALTGCGATAMGAGGWLGGHLAYAFGVGVDTNAFEGGPTEWTAVVEGSRRADQAVWPGAVAAVGVVLVNSETESSGAARDRGGADPPRPGQPLQPSGRPARRGASAEAAASSAPGIEASSIWSLVRWFGDRPWWGSRCTRHAGSGPGWRSARDEHRALVSTACVRDCRDGRHQSRGHFDREA